MPNANRYRTLSREYAAQAERSASLLMAEGYRKLARGYAMLAEGQDALSASYRSERRWLNEPDFPIEPQAQSAQLPRIGSRRMQPLSRPLASSATEV